MTLTAYSGEVFALETVAAALPREPIPERPRPSMSPSYRGDDRLRTIPAEDYIPALTGREMGRNRKVACPFHEDVTPSLHVYESDWYCFGCCRGGSVIDFGANLYGIEPQGRGFHEIRVRLAHDLGGVAA